MGVIDMDEDCVTSIDCDSGTACTVVDCSSVKVCAINQDSIIMIIAWMF